MLQSVHDCKKFYCGMEWVPSELVIGGDQPFVRRLIGVSISPMVGSIYNMGVWDKVAAALVKAGVRRTLEGEAVAHRRYQDTGLSLENGGCVGDQHIVVERCLVFLCILHCCMAMGRLQVAFIEACLGDLPKDNAVAVQRVLYRAHTGVRLGASSSLDREEARALFLAWEEIGPLLAYPWRMVSGKPWLPCGTSSGTCTQIPHRAPTYGPQRSRGRTACIVARPPTNRTTSSTWRRT